MIIARKIAYNVLVSSVSKILSTILALVAVGFITRYLGKDGFGDYATVLAFLSFFSAVSDLGLYQLSTREISREGANSEQVMGNVFAMRMLSSLAVFAISPVLMLFFPYSEPVKLGIVVIAGSFVFSSGYQVLNGVFQKHLAMDKVAVSELLGKIVQLGVVIVAVRLSLGFGWIVASMLFNGIVSFALVFFWSKKYVTLSFRFDIAYWKKFLRNSYPIGISSLVVFVYFKMDTILLSMMKTSSEVGIYNAAYKVLENISFFPAMIIGLIFPIMSQHIHSDKKRFLDISNKTIKVFILLVIPLVVGTLFLSEGVIRLIGGIGFDESANVLRMLVFALAAIFFSNFFNAMLIAGNMQKRLMAVLSLAAGLNVALNLALIPRYSYDAAAAVSFLTEAFVAVAGGLVAYRSLGYRISVERISRILLSGIFMAFVLFLLRGRNFFLSGFLGVGAYVLFLWISRAVETSEITSIFGRKGIKEYEEPIA